MHAQGGWVAAGLWPGTNMHMQSFCHCHTLLDMASVLTDPRAPSVSKCAQRGRGSGGVLVGCEPALQIADDIARLIQPT